MPTQELITFDTVIFKRGSTKVNDQETALQRTVFATDLASCDNVTAIRRDARNAESCRGLNHIAKLVTKELSNL